METSFARSDLVELFQRKYGAPAVCGPAPRRRWWHGYFTPADHYEAVVTRLVTSDAAWIDIGGGAAPFPENARLSRLLADRARRLIVVDPSDNLLRNPYAHERAQCAVDEYQSNDGLDLATLRMVAEHVADPVGCVSALRRLVRPGGHVVVLTVNKWSPTTIASRLVPFRLHHAIKRVFWGGDERDTFPVVYRMNTRRALRRLFEADGFAEESFHYLDDLSVLARFSATNTCELLAWRLIKHCGLRYPEQCLLGVYRRL